MNRPIADTISITEAPVGIARWIVRCSAHPDWKPPSSYHRDAAEFGAESHTYNVHDGIDYESLPEGLVRALRNIREPEFRRAVAREARAWAAPKSAPEPTRQSPFNLAAIIEGMGDLDPRLVRAEIAMRLIRVAAGNLAGSPYTGAFRVLEEAKAVLGPATNGINGAGVGYAVEYVERFLDTLAETGAKR